MLSDALVAEEKLEEHSRAIREIEADLTKYGDAVDLLNHPAVCL